MSKVVVLFGVADWPLARTLENILKSSPELLRIRDEFGRECWLPSLPSGKYQTTCLDDGMIPCNYILSGSHRQWTLAKETK